MKKILKKLNEYNKKQELILEKKKEREEILEKEMIERKRILSEKERKCNEKMRN